MDISNIDVSLTYGQLYTKKHFSLLYICLAISLLMPILTVVLFFLPDVEWDRFLIVTVVLFNLFSLFLLAVVIFALAQDKKAKNKVRLWLEDAIEIKAFANFVSEKMTSLTSIATKIQVDFMLDGKHYYKVSGVKHAGWQAGYDKAFTKYVNKEVNIMYSPKYNEVMILKKQHSKKVTICEATIRSANS